MYRSSQSEGFSSSDSGYTDHSISNPVDPAEQKLRRHIVESFKKAVENGNSSLVTYYFNEHPENNLGESRWRNGDSCLHVAVQQKNEELLRLLLGRGVEHGVDLNAQNSVNGDTALHTAVKGSLDGDESIVRVLMEYEMDTHIMNTDFVSALHIAVEHRQYEVMDLLSKYALDLETASYGSSTPSTAGGDARDAVDAEVDDEKKNGGIFSLRSLKSCKSMQLLQSLGPVDDDSDDSVDPELVPMFSGRASVNGIENFAETLLSANTLDTLEGLEGSGQWGEGILSETEYEKLTIEERMDEDAKYQLTKLNLKNKNPFSKLKVTKQDGQEMSALMRALAQLPDLDGFLLKQTSRPPYSYRKRWVIVLDGWFLWNDTQIAANFDEDEGPTAEERKRFKGAVNLNNVMEVGKTGKSGRKFVFKVRFKTHEKLRYQRVLWKCHDEPERDYWCSGLQQYVDYCKEVKKLRSEGAKRRRADSQ